MNRSNPILRRSLYCLVVLSLARSVRADDYKIVLSRPFKAGDQYVTNINVKVDESGPQGKNKFAAELKGTVKVLAVNQTTGSATKLSLKVDKSTKDGQDFLPAGTVITAEKVNHQSVYSIDGKALDKAMDKDDRAEVIDAMLDVTDPDSKESDDDISGTDKPKKVGDSWPINKEALVKASVDLPFPLTTDEVKGETTLAEVKKVNGTEVMVLKTTTTGTVAKAAMNNGLSIQDAKFDVTATGTMPTDKSMPILSTQETMSLSMTMIAPNNAGQFKLDLKRDRTEEREPVKP